jgi:hypothetical protein
MAPVKKIAKKGSFWSFCSCFQPEIAKVIEPSARPPPPPPVVVPIPMPPTPPVPNLLTTPMPTLEELEAEVHSDGSDIIDVDMGTTVIRSTEEKNSITLSSVMLVLTAIALATLLLNVD